MPWGLTFMLLQNDKARIFLRTSWCNTEKSYQYMPCVAIDSLSASREGFANIESYDNNGKYELLGVLNSDKPSPFSTTLLKRDNNSYEDIFDIIYKTGCSFDMQIHIGECTRPDVFNSYSKALVMDDVICTSVSKTPLAVISSGERSVVENTLAISFNNYSTVLPVNYSYKLVQPPVGPFVDVASQSPDACPECLFGTKNCDTVLALRILNDPDNVGIAQLYLYYSFDCGKTFQAQLLPCMPIAHAQDSICGDIVFLGSPNINLVGNMIIITTSPGQTTVYSLNDLYLNDTLTQTSFTGQFENNTLLGVMHSVSNKKYTLTAMFSGELYLSENTTGNVVKVDLGTTNGIYSVDMDNDNNWIASGTGVFIGNSANLLYSTNAVPTGGFNVSINKDRYLYATLTDIYTSCNGIDWQKTWSTPTNTPTGYCINNITFYDKNTGYMTLNNLDIGYGPLIYRTIDGGFTFTKVKGTQIPPNYSLFAVSPTNENIFYAVGFTNDSILTCRPVNLWQNALAFQYDAIIISGTIDESF